MGMEHAEDGGQQDDGSILSTGEKVFAGILIAVGGVGQLGAGVGVAIGGAVGAFIVALLCIMVVRTVR
jgi:hypothetical protein